MLEAIVAHARAQGLLVIADGKRGDIATSATAYGQALLRRDRDAVRPRPGPRRRRGDRQPAARRGRARAADRRSRASADGTVFVLVRTSNPGAADLFDAELADGRPLWERIARLVDVAGTPGPQSGLSDVGAVTGATVPGHLARLRELMPRTPFLLPGIGAQGGDVAALAPAFAPGRAGGLVSASRSIADAHAQTGRDARHAARAEAERLREQAWALV